MTAPPPDLSAEARRLVLYVWSTDRADAEAEVERALEAAERRGNDPTIRALVAIGALSLLALAVVAVLAAGAAWGGSK